GLLVNSLGWGLAFRSGVGVLLTALIIPPLLARIRAEENLLRTQFGAAYDAFCARTWRLIPGLYQGGKLLSQAALAAAAAGRCAFRRDTGELEDAELAIGTGGPKPAALALDVDFAGLE